MFTASKGKEKNFEIFSKNGKREFWDLFDSTRLIVFKQVVI
jgi:hypothetical protein